MAGLLHFFVINVNFFLASVIIVNLVIAMTAPEMKSVATKIDPDTLSEVERISRETGLKTADLLRIGLRKLIENYTVSGKLEVGKEAA